MSFNTQTASAAGRKSSRKGVGNKSTASLKKRLTQLLEDQFDTVLDNMEQLEAKDHVSAYIKLLEYCVPKQRNITETIDVSSLSDDQVNEMLDRILEERNG